MKKFNLFLVLISAVAANIFTSCDDVPVPNSDLTWYATEDFNLNRENEMPDTVLVGQSITFMANNADGDVYTVWPGEEGLDYSKKDLSDTVPNDTNYVSLKNKGIALGQNNQGEFITKYGYIYTKPGTYTVTLVARNLIDGGDDYTEAVSSHTIVVVDPENSLVGTDAAKYKFIITKPKYSTYVIENDSIKITVPFGADVANTELFMVANRASISAEVGEITYNSVKQAYIWKGDLADLTTLYVTSLSGDVREYVVDYSEAAPSTENDLLTFGVGSYSGVVNGTTVTLTVPENLAIDAVQPKFTVSTGATLKDGSTTLANNADPKIDLSSGSKTLTVTSQSGATKNYTINIVEIPTELTALSFQGLNPVRTATINQSTKAIAVSVYNGTDLTTLVPTFTITQFAKLYLGDETSTTEITSGETEIDLSGTDPIKITVKVSATDFVTYTVTVTVL